MNSSVVDVEPKEFVTVRNASTATIRVINLELGKYVDCLLNICESNGNSFQSDMYHIEGEEYDNWGNSDDYLINLVLSKAGLTRKPASN